jgi:glycosyltransferase involved in cell wall biosynthesis
MGSVDIVIPNYNYGRYLRACVESVLTQGIDDLRVLIVDNASTDDSVEVARGLAEQDSRIEIVARETNLGPHASWNDGIDWARSDYLLTLCADDLLAPGALACAIAVLDQNPDAVFAYGNDLIQDRHSDGAAAVECVAPQWDIISGIDFIKDRCRNPEVYIAAGMVVARTRVQKQVGYYRPELPHTDDFEVLLRLACFGNAAYTKSVLSVKRMHGANRTEMFLAQRTRDLVEREAAFDIFFRNEGRMLAGADRLHRLAKDSIAERAYWCAVGDLVRRYGSATELFRLAFRLSPMTAFVPPVNYLLRMERPVSRIGRIIRKAVKNR